MNKSDAAGPASTASTAGIGRTVALVGVDGAGKSTVAREVVRRLPIDAGYLYMGVNLEVSPVMLPTTRLALALKRRRGGRSDMTVGHVEPGGRRRGPLYNARRLVRMVNWLAEEAYRATLARQIRRRPAVVVFDRHFFCDYYAGAIAPTAEHRPFDTRIHGYVLNHWYPRPDLTLFLDAPPNVLIARKGEGTVASVAKRRLEYLDLAGVLPAFDVVDVDRPTDEVVDDVVARILAFVGAEQAGRRTPALADRTTTAPEPDTAGQDPAADSSGHARDVPVERQAAAAALGAPGADARTTDTETGAGIAPAVAEIAGLPPVDSTTAAGS